MLAEHENPLVDNGNNNGKGIVATHRGLLSAILEAAIWETK